MGIKFGPIRSGRDKNQSEVAEAHLAFFISRSWMAIMNIWLKKCYDLGLINLGAKYQKLTWRTCITG